MKFRLSPYLWSVSIMAAALAFSLFVASYNQPAMAEAQIPYQETPLWLILTYFFSAVVVISLVLFFLPMKYLKYVFRVVFAIMFAWGVLVVTFFHLPDPASYTLAAVAGLAWIFFARIWLHNLLLLVALAAAASVFGFVFSPWTFMIFMLVVSVYDVLSVRFGLMVWMADKLSNTVSLPAFVFPKNAADVRLNLQSVQVGELKNVSAEKREHTILGGGDIGFPLMLANSVYFAHGMNAAILTGAFAIVGLVGAFLMQKFLYKGKPVPALPPIAIMSLVGFLIGSNYLV